MKKLKWIVAALALVITTTAFTWQRNDDDTEKDITDYAYFHYQLCTSDGENDPSNWVKVSPPEEYCSEGNEVLYIILAPIANLSDIHPDFTGISDVRTSSMITHRVFTSC